MDSNSNGIKQEVIRELEYFIGIMGKPCYNQNIEERQGKEEVTENGLWAFSNKYVTMKNRMEMIGNRIKIFREHSGFTQKNIADYLEVDQDFVSMVEKGKQVLTVDLLEKLADLFGVSFDAFEEEKTDIRVLSFALRASEIDETDMETIRVINRIALNSRFMRELLEKRKEHG